MPFSKQMDTAKLSEFAPFVPVHRQRLGCIKTWPASANQWRGTCNAVKKEKPWKSGRGDSPAKRAQDKVEVPLNVAQRAKLAIRRSYWRRVRAAPGRKLRIPRCLPGLPRLKQKNGENR